MGEGEWVRGADAIQSCLDYCNLLYIQSSLSKYIAFSIVTVYECVRDCVFLSRVYLIMPVVIPVA